MKPALALLLLGSILLSACATRPTVPAEELGAARSAVASAEDAGARDFAPTELRDARSMLEQAESLRASDDFVRARRLAREAEVEARFAAFKARSARSSAMIAELQQSNAVLEEEIEAARESARQQQGDPR